MQSAVPIALAAALAGASYIFGVPGVFESARRLEERKAQLEADVAYLRKTTDLLEKIQRERAPLVEQSQQMRVQLESVYKIIPREAEPEYILKMLQKDAAATGVHLWELTALPALGREFYTEVPIRLQVDGRYKDVLSFLRRLHREERMSSVPRLLLSSAHDAKALEAGIGPKQRLLAECVVTTYAAK
jgi:type IV pilus assembly protein PilO